MYCPGVAALTAAERPRCRGARTGQLGEVPAHEREVVPLVELPDPQDAVLALLVAQRAPQGEAGVGRVGDQPAVADDLHRLVDGPRLGVDGVHVEVPGHGRTVCRAHYVGRVRALVKTTAGPGLELLDVPEPRWGRPTSRSGSCGPGCAAPTCTSSSGTTGRPSTVQRADDHRPRVLRRGRRGGRGRRPASQVGDRVSGEGHIVCGTLPQLPRRAPAPVHPHRGRRGQPRRRLRRLRRHPRRPTSGCSPTTSTPTSARSSTRSATPRTPRCSCPWPARTSSSPAPARSG